MRRLFVLFHSPGPAWDQKLAFMEQPGIGEHIAFMRSLTERGLLVLGGPFGDDDPRISVGMAVVSAPDAGEAERLAQEDRSVEHGLLRVAVRPWVVPMGGALDAIPEGEG